MESLLQDLKFGLRLLWKEKGFTITALLTLSLCIAYAITDEVHQMFVPDRYADVRDVLSDAAGAGAGLGLLYLAQTVLPRRNTT